MSENCAHLAHEVMAARQELGNIMHILNDLTDRVVVVAAQLNKTYDKAQGAQVDSVSP